MRRIILELLRLNAGLVAVMKYENYQDTVAPIANSQYVVARERRQPVIH